MHHVRQDREDTLHNERSYLQLCVETKQARNPQQHKRINKDYNAYTYENVRFHRRNRKYIHLFHLYIAPDFVTQKTRIL